MTRIFSGTSMEMTQGRSIEVDFLRGVVLIVIVLDHIPGSVLSHLMLHSYALCDSAEVFVFLGGYASAAAYCAVRSRAGPEAARLRFLRRCWEIYRAYLLTAVLTLAIGALLVWFNLNPHMVELTGWPSFSSAPLRQAIDIAVLRRQPYLSSVLPMYVIFAVFVPVVVPLAIRSAVATLTLSLALWLVARPLAQFVRIDDLKDWAFNPFAWQLMFVLGILSRLHPADQRWESSPWATWMTRIALVAALGFAGLRLFVLTQPLPGTLKANLSWERVVNFVVIAWLVARLVRFGSMAWLAQRLPAVVTVGQTGLVCFVAGTVISPLIDTATSYDLHGLTGFMVALSGDIVAIISMLLIALGWNEWKSRHALLAVNAAQCGGRTG